MIKVFSEYGDFTLEKIKVFSENGDFTLKKTKVFSENGNFMLEKTKVFSEYDDLTLWVIIYVTIHHGDTEITENSFNNYFSSYRKIALKQYGELFDGMQHQYVFFNNHLCVSLCSLCLRGFYF